MLGGEATNEAVVRARATGSAAVGLSSRGLLPLLDIARARDHVAWVYAWVDGVSLRHVVGSELYPLSTRAAAEVVAAVAEALIRVDDAGLAHPGPVPEDILVDHRGRLWLSGLGGPPSRVKALRAPQGNGGEADLVYRLGVLLAWLVSGVLPPPASVVAEHPALIRHTLIRAMARPGPVLTERYSDWLRGMLAWDPAERPPLSAVPVGLRKVGETTGGLDLVDWAELHVDEVLTGLTRRRRAAPVHEQPTSEEWNTESIRRRISADAAGLDVDYTVLPTILEDQHDTVVARLDDLPDDPTQEAAAAPSETPTAATGRAAMPVSIGPPVEAMPRRQPRLPEGFLDGGATVSTTTRPAAPSPRPVLADIHAGDDWFWVWPALLGAGVAALAILALLLLVVVLWSVRRESEVDETPTLGEVLTAPAEPD